VCSTQQARGRHAAGTRQARGRHAAGTRQARGRYDWFFFDVRHGDSIMNIEPAMLLMAFSIPPHASSTKSCPS
jgi:hypothetical protein